MYGEWEWEEGHVIVGPISSHRLFYISLVLGPDITRQAKLVQQWIEMGFSGWSCFARPRDLLLFVDCICSAFVEWIRVLLQASIRKPFGLESFEIGLKWEMMPLLWKGHRLHNCEGEVWNEEDCWPAGLGEPRRHWRKLPMTIYLSLFFGHATSRMIQWPTYYLTHQH